MCRSRHCQRGSPPKTVSPLTVQVPMNTDNSTTSPVLAHEPANVSTPVDVYTLKDPAFIFSGDALSVRVCSCV